MLLETVLPIIGLAWLGVWLYTHRPPRPVDAVCARVDEDADRPLLVGLDDTVDSDPFDDLDREWLALHRIGGAL